MKRPLGWLAASAILSLAGAGPIAAEGGLVAEYAVLLGDRDGVPEVTSAQAAAVFSWTAATGTENLRQLFGLGTLDALQLGKALLTPTGGDFAASGGHPSGEINIRFRVRPTASGEEQAATTEVEVWQDREILAAPTVTAPLGEPALLSSGFAAEHGLLWVVVRVSRAPTVDAPQG